MHAKTKPRPAPHRILRHFNIAKFRSPDLTTHNHARLSTSPPPRLALPRPLLGPDFATSPCSIKESETLSAISHNGRISLTFDIDWLFPLWEVNHINGAGGRVKYHRLNIEFCLETRLELIFFGEPKAFFS